jgi:hypothetical protein
VSICINVPPRYHWRMCRTSAIVAVLNKAIHAASGLTQYIPNEAASITKPIATRRMVHPTRSIRLREIEASRAPVTQHDGLVLLSAGEILPYGNRTAAAAKTRLGIHAPFLNIVVTINAVEAPNRAATMSLCSIDS